MENDINTSNIIELLDELFKMVDEAWGVPLGNDKCIIERARAIDIIDRIKENLPSSLAEANRLVAARDEFIGNAKREAEALRKSAEEKAKNLVEEQEVMREAKARSSELIASAEVKSEDLKKGAVMYVNHLMSNAEEALEKAKALLGTTLVTIQNAQTVINGEKEKSEASESVSEDEEST